MKNKSYIGISFIILIFGIIFIPKIVDRIKNGQTVQNDRMSLSNEIKDEAAKKTLVVMGQVPQFSLTNQDNKNITQDSYKGKVYVLEFFFASCPSICPVMNKNMLKLQQQFGKNPDFAIASITIDPEKDTAEVLKEHAQSLGVTMKNWHFLTGDKATIFDLSNKGFNIYAGESKDKVNGGFEHSGLFALIDKKGNIRCRRDAQGNPILYYDGLEAPGIKAISEDIQRLLNE
ncbi:SCO family protein [Flavobacterium sp.]|jgi:protein SCO1/2|uniref:SCO family protein n=1 Tax=Flavobacterium sp. TaxID=239 RepID=UPI0022CB1AA2|nr:SCO family protein [Flavobacterium sp.]MCZ8144204.1 SCO family protein [Flavobacterium sp.]MCZ8365933.1 SCO family protein [Flavobacterium sp.]